MFGLSNGIGTRYDLLSSDALSIANKSTYTAVILFILSMCFAKCSVIVLMMKLFNLRGPRANSDRKSKVNKILCFAALALIGVWGIGSVIGLSAGCDAEKFTETATDLASCPAQDIRWDVVTALDVTTEVILVILAILIVAPVRLSVKMKIPIIIAFGFRLM